MGTAVHVPRSPAVAFSRGVPYAIRCAARHPERVAGLALGDYAAVHTRLPQRWVRRFLAGSWRGTPVAERVPEAVVRAIQRESVRVLDGFLRDLEQSPALSPGH